MTTDGVDDYLQRLRSGLEQRRLLSGRILDEVRDHLRDAIDDGLRRGLSREAAEREAVTRFGSADLLSSEFEHVYRRSYALWYLAKIAATVVASVAVALAVEVIVNLRGGVQAEALRLAPQFGRTSMVAVAIVLGLATVWEIARKPFQLRRGIIAAGAYVAICLTANALFTHSSSAFGAATLMVCLGAFFSRLERHPAQLLTTFALFVLSLEVVHRIAHVGVDLLQALMASAVMLVIWISTITILSRGDQIFFQILHAHE